MSSTDAPGTLEERALQRKRRLLSLKRKREGKTAPVGPNLEVEDPLPTPIFRSYVPVDKDLRENVISDIRPEDIGEQVKDQLDSAKSQIVMDQLDVTSLAPRKPDWDLKRDLAKKMDQLERQTQRAIGELIRERLNKKNEDLASIVNAGVSILDK